MHLLAPASLREVQFLKSILVKVAPEPWLIDPQPPSLYVLRLSMHVQSVKLLAGFTASSRNPPPWSDLQFLKVVLVAVTVPVFW